SQRIPRFYRWSRRVARPELRPATTRACMILLQRHGSRKPNALAFAREVRPMRNIAFGVIGVLWVV
ncbi:MAG TPA: hypothetical protein VG099_27295, partial [Gemmataceae bacterium]|nr:hypothetical protein [Gemmataceae bacterium]